MMTRASQLPPAAAARRRNDEDLGMPIMDGTSYMLNPNEPPSPHATPDSDLSGWLWMRSSLLGRWRHRYFSFTQGVLSYYESFPSEEFIKQQTLSSNSASPAHHLIQHATALGTGAQPRGVLRVAHIEEINNKLGFKVFATSGKVIEIRAPRSDIRQTWLAALRATAFTRSRSWSASNHEHHQDFLSPSSKAASAGIMRSTDPLNDCSVARDTLRVDKCGWLLKRSDILRRWNRYYFVLQDRMLSYYMTDRPYDVPRRRGYIQGVRRDTKRTDTLVVSLSAGNELHLRLPTRSAETLSGWFDKLVVTAMLQRPHTTGSLPPIDDSGRDLLALNDPKRHASNDSTDDSLDHSFI
ncbi:hypothetical protein H310_04467 [Aphanomyces invadans]|uniref:PH domain-containing protein n=1 Tax=Aphanomyces invadans TaxID=157072 RepID=A0A024UEP6_9STRA|nr:hypothetical protein H310_04467 [Aphanomyces invadans]ETW04103.1 hypothetical protein H310_04467 [Aphanomyces invadans]|eukprot:XP_008867059.1 hypothetical protein H310_04467 [Aphanomyces invadans]